MSVFLNSYDKERETEREKKFDSTLIPNLSRVEKGYYVIEVKNDVRQLFHVKGNVKRSCGSFLNPGQTVEDFRIAEPLPMKIL